MKKVRYILFLFLCFIFIMGIIFLPNIKKYYKNIVSKKYSEANVTVFDLNLFGATGWSGINQDLKESANDNSNKVGTVTAGQSFMILGEKGDFWEVIYNNQHGYIKFAYCMINLPDVLTSARYDIKNAYSSIYRTKQTRGSDSIIDIPDVTGEVLYGSDCYQDNQYRTCTMLGENGKIMNYRLGSQEFIVPSLYSTAKMIGKGAHIAQQEGYRIKIYDSYRPFDVSAYVSTKFDVLYNDSTKGVKDMIDTSYNNATNTFDGSTPAVSWSKTWFISSVVPGTHISDHNVGAAIDVSLCKIDKINGTETCTDVDMYTPMHQLSTDSVKYKKPVATVNRAEKNKDSYSVRMDNDGNAKLLDTFLQEGAGMDTLSSEWWHFRDYDGADNMKTLTSNYGFNFQVTSIVSDYGFTDNIKNVGDVNGDGVVNSDDAELIYKLYKFLQNNTCDTCGTLIQYSDMNGDLNINLDDIYLILNKDNDLITSSYSLGDGYIDVGNGTFDSSNITLKNVPNVSSYVSDNKYFITYHDEEIKSYDIVSYSNDDHDLSKSYLLYKGGLDQAAAERTSGKFNCTNCVVEYDFDNNKVYIKKSSESSNSLREYDIVYPIYEGHDLTKAYIYTGNDPYEASNAMRDSRFTSVNSSLIYYNNKVYIVKKLNSTENVDMENMPSDDIYATYDVVFYFSDDYVLGDSVDLNSNKVDDLLDKIHCYNCDISIYNGDNRITSGNIPSGSKIIINENVTTNKKKLEDSTVNYPVSSVSLNESNITLGIGEHKQLSANITPDYSTNKNVIWESSNPSIVTVDSTGKITGVSTGEATVTVTTEDGSHTSTCNVTVNAIVKHTLTYKDRDWTYSHDYEEGSTVELKSDYTRQGYIFKGWKDSNNQEYTDKFTMPDHDAELTAILELAKPAIQNDNYNLVNDDSNDISVLTGIDLRTDVENLDLQISSIYDYHVYNNKGVEKTSGNLGTGDKIKIYLNTDNDVFVTEYVVSIKGDVNGDGDFKVGDIVKLYNYLFEGFPGECYKNAADYNNDGKNLVGDIIKMYNALFES